VNARAAFHEAGHVLVALSLGRSVESVSVTPLAGGGVTIGEPLRGDATPEEIEAALTVAFAGEAAEQYADEAVAPVRNGDGGDPYFTVGELAALADADTADGRPSDGEAIDYYRDRIGAEAVERARALAVELVWRHAALGRLSLLAGEIFARHHITNTELEQIIGGEEKHA
jgi:hypothetical protein